MRDNVFSKCHTHSVRSGLDVLGIVLGGHGLVEVGRVDLEADEPSVLLGALVHQPGVVVEGLVHLDDLALDWGEHVARCLDGLNGGHRAAAANDGWRATGTTEASPYSPNTDLVPHVGERNKHYVAQLVLGVSADADGRDLVLNLREPRIVAVGGLFARDRGPPRRPLEAQVKSFHQAHRGDPPGRGGARGQTPQNAP
jgi:hypothetical protein